MRSERGSLDSLSITVSPGRARILNGSGFDTRRWSLGEGYGLAIPFFSMLEQVQTRPETAVPLLEALKENLLQMIDPQEALNGYRTAINQKDWDTAREYYSEANAYPGVAVLLKVITRLRIDTPSERAFSAIEDLKITYASRDPRGLFGSTEIMEELADLNERYISSQPTRQEQSLRPGWLTEAMRDIDASLFPEE